MEEQIPIETSLNQTPIEMVQEIISRDVRRRITKEQKQMIIEYLNSSVEFKNNCESVCSDTSIKDSRKVSNLIAIASSLIQRDLELNPSFSMLKSLFNTGPVNIVE